MATAKEKREVEIVINGTKANASIRDMEKALRILSSQLKDMPRGTQEWKDKMVEVGKQKATLDEIRNSIKGVSNEMTLAEKATSKLGGVFGAVFGALTFDRLIGQVVSLVQQGIRLRAVYSDAFSDIQKSTGMSAEEVAELNKNLAEVDTRTSQLDLLGIAKVGGQIGIAKEEIEAFTISVDKAVVALGDEFAGGAEEVAKRMGTLQLLFKETKDLSPAEAIEKIGSAVNELGAAGTATGPVVAEFAARIGQLGDLAPQIDQTLGLGAAMQEMGLSAEIASGGLSNIFLTAGKESAAFAKQIGITNQEFKNLMNSDPNEMLLKLAESMRGMSNTDIIAVMDNLKLGSQESIKVMSLLANQTDKVREKQELASKAMKEATSLTNEFNIKNQNEAAILAKTQKQWEAMKVTIGEQFMPIVGDGMRIVMPLLKGLTTGFVTFINILKALPGFVAENKDIFIGLGVALVTFNAAQIAASASVLYHTAIEKGRAIATTASATAQRALNVVMAANPIGLIVTAVALLVTGLIALYNRSEAVRATMSGLFDAAKQVFTNIAQIAAKILGGVGDLLVGVFTLDVDKIKSGLKSAFTGLVEAHTGLGKGVADAYNKGYDKKMAEEAAKQKAEAKKAAEEKAMISAQTSKAGLDQQLSDLRNNENDKTVLTLKEQKARAKANRDAAKEQSKEDKKAADDAKKAAEDRLKAEEEISKRKIALIGDEYEQKRAKIKAEADKEVANLVGTEEQKKQLTKMIRQQMWNELDALEADQEEKATKAALDAENRRRTALAELKLIQAEENGSPEDILEAQLEQLELEREMKLQDHTLLKEEIEAINAEFDQRERDAAKELAEYKKTRILEGLDTGLKVASDLFNAMNAYQRADTDKKISDTEKVKNEKIKKLDEQLAANQISQQTYDAEKQRAEDEYNAKVNKMKTEQQKKNKKAAMVQAVINTALAVSSALQGMWPAAIAFAALAAVMGGIQIATIAKQPVETFAKGGYTAKKPKNNFIKWSDVIDHYAVGGYTGGSVQQKATFAHGGPVDSPTMGLIGEAGAEWVMPNWMLTSPKYANIAGYLESERRAKKFAEGGPTTGSMPGATSGSLDNSPGIAESNAKFDALITSVEGLRSDLNAWQGRIHAVYDVAVIDDELNDLYKLRAQGTIS